MQVDLIEGRTAIAELRSQWDAVYQADPEAHYFLSYEWLFGTAEAAGAGSFVIAVRAPQGEPGYAAFLPVRLTTKHDSEGFYNEIILTGNYVSDYNGFICKPEFEEMAIPALAQRLQKMNWRRLRLLNLPTSFKRLDLFLKAFSGEILKLKHLKTIEPDGTNNGVCPHTILTGDWDDFLSQRVSKNTRQKIRRFLRQVESSDAYRFTHTTSETLDRDMDILNRLWVDKWGERKGKRLNAILKTQRRMLRTACATNTLFMPMLWHGDRPICVLTILVDQKDKTYNFYIGARDTRFQGPPPGLVLHAYAIRHAISQGFGKYDFLRGDEPYKYSFGSEDAKIRSLLLITQSGKNLGEKLDRRCLRYVLQRSGAFYNAGDLAAAERGYAQILDAEPNALHVRYMHGVIAARLGDNDTAYREFAKLVEHKPHSLKTWLRLGRALMAGKKGAGEAQKTGTGLLNDSMDVAKIISLFGRALLKLDLADHALAVVKAALRLDPDNADLQGALAKALRIRRPGTTLRDGQQALKNSGIDIKTDKIPVPNGSNTQTNAKIVTALDIDAQRNLAFDTMSRKTTETALERVMVASNSTRVTPTKSPDMQRR
ncbi:GNAT family N-acetyltransferase [Ruegeria lacuscaerulensis]|uniref:GNAT family N-acetyltransferase n=1 Tax=Ruegeria lacuscaerulensis TaxID=55218 RepID=UPI00147D15CC